MAYKGKDGITRTEEEIEALIDEGHEDPSALFGNFSGKNKKRHQKSLVKKVNVDFTEMMLVELDKVADYLNISRQAVIKTYVLNGLTRFKSKVS